MLIPLNSSPSCSNQLNIYSTEIGIRFYLYPDFSKLGNTGIWVDAACNYLLFIFIYLISDRIFNFDFVFQHKYFSRCLFHMVVLAHSRHIIASMQTFIEMPL